MCDNDRCITTGGQHTGRLYGGKRMITIDLGEVETCGNRETIKADISTLISEISTSMLEFMHKELHDELTRRA